MPPLSVPPPIRHVPDGEVCYVCYGASSPANPVLGCTGGCGLKIHAACIGKRQMAKPPKQGGGGRKRKKAAWDDGEAAAEAEAAAPTSDSPPPAGGRPDARADSAITPSKFPSATSSDSLSSSEKEGQDGCSSSCWQCERCAAIVGKRVFARTGGSSFFWPARVLARDPYGQVKVEWEALDDLDSAFAKGDGHGYACEIVGAAGRKPGLKVSVMAVQFEDGLQYDAPTTDLRVLLDEPLFKQAANMETLQGRQRLADTGANPSARSDRSMAKGVWCTDSAQCGPLQRTMRRFERVWRGPKVEGEPWALEKFDQVPGLYSCPNFLSLEEVQLLRLLFNAHHGWSLYNWGSVGRHNELASVMSRIDFGVEDMTAEGVAASRSSVQPLGELQQQVVDMLQGRLREAFGVLCWGGNQRNAPDVPKLTPNMMQFTRIAPNTCLGNHFDRRDKWDEGIASIAWGADHGEVDPRGDEWELRMCRGAIEKPTETVTMSMPAGCAYIISGVAQGRTAVCQRRCVAHESCLCCWTHGIWNEKSEHERNSITMRVYNNNWGRPNETVCPKVGEDDEDDEPFCLEAVELRCEKCDQNHPTDSCPWYK